MQQAPHLRLADRPGFGRAAVLSASLFAGLAVWSGPAPAHAADQTRYAPANGAEVSIDVGQADLMLPGAGATVFVANPDIADAQVIDARRVVIVGKKPGHTTVYVFTAGGAATDYSVTVRPPASGLADALRAAAPGAAVEVSRGPEGTTVSGHVATPSQAEALKATAQRYMTDNPAQNKVDGLNFRVTVDASAQVNLQIRVAEVSRQVSNDLGFSWNALFNDGTVAIGLMTGRNPITAAGQFLPDPSGATSGTIGVGYNNGSVNLAALVDALQSKGLVTTLAEPNLTATSGASASFLAGGEFPVPISQGLNQISIEWKNFGVSVDFTPTVLDHDRISVRVRPEVSELSDVGAVVINNIKIPSVTVRRADTTVELGSGQSFAIAGLYQNNLTNSVRDFPGLSSLPILGPLLRSSSFRQNQSELVIIVTAYIVRPVSSPRDLHLPTEGVIYANELEQILLGRITHGEGAASANQHPHLSGPAGFMLEDQH